MDFEWDVLGTSAGNTIVYKDTAKLSRCIKSKSDARAAAARDAQLTNLLAAEHGNIVTIIDVAGVKLRRVVYTYVKASIRENPARPLRTHAVNVPLWAAKVYRVVRPLLSAEDIQSTSVHTGPYDPLVHL
jgi:hypothetical protein